ncbi:MAG: IS5 family transposase [Chloroflexota bacterium]
MATQSEQTEGYPSDVTDEQWSIIEPHLSQKQRAGRPLSLEVRQLLNAIFYIVRNGITWRAMPKDFPKWSSVYYHFRKWCKDGTWQTINETLRKEERIRRGRAAEPSGAIIDSQSVKTTEAGGERGFDGGKLINGRKRHAAVDTIGNLLEVVVNAANTDDRDGAKLVLNKLSADSIDLGITFRPPNSSGFVVVPFRWVVERTFAWLGRYRRLSKDYEHCTKSSEGVIYVASINTMLKRLANPI